jgi:hypothetical protein
MVNPPLTANAVLSCSPTVPLSVMLPVTVADAPEPERLHTPGLLTVTDPIVVVVVKVGSSVEMVASKVLPLPLFGKVLLQFDQSATVVQLAVASFQEQVKFAAWAAGAPVQTRPLAATDAADRPRKKSAMRPRPTLIASRSGSWLGHHCDDVITPRG